MTPSSSTQAQALDAAMEALGLEPEGQEPSDSHPWVSRDDVQAAITAYLAALPTEADNYGGASDGIALADAIRPPATEAVEPVGKLDHTALEAAKAAFRINPMADGALDAAILAYLAALPQREAEPVIKPLLDAIAKHPKALNATRFNQFAALYPEVASAIRALTSPTVAGAALNGEQCMATAVMADRARRPERGAEPVAWTSHANLRELEKQRTGQDWIYSAVMGPENTAEMNVPLYTSPTVAGAALNGDQP